MASEEEKKAARSLARKTPEAKARQKENRKRYKAREKEAYRKRAENPITWGAAIINRIRHRAKTKKIEFSLTALDLIVPDKCPVFGVPFVMNVRGNPGGVHFAPSVDRFDNDKGYTPENIRIISNRANLLKKDATKEEIEMLLVYMESAA